MLKENGKKVEDISKELQELTNSIAFEFSDYKLKLLAEKIKFQKEKKIRFVNL